MANLFTNSMKPSIGIANTEVYKGPIATQSTVIGLSIANKTIANTLLVSAYVLDSANNYAPAFLVSNATVAIGSTLIIVGGDQKIVLKSNDSIQVTSSANASADAIVSVLQIT